MGCSIPHAGISFSVLLFIMNLSDNGLIEKLKLVTWRPVNCVVHDSGWNTCTGKYKWLTASHINVLELNKG